VAPARAVIRCAHIVGHAPPGGDAAAAPAGVVIPASTSPSATPTGPAAHTPGRPGHRKGASAGSDPAASVDPGPPEPLPVGAYAEARFDIASLSKRKITIDIMHIPSSTDPGAFSLDIVPSTVTLKRGRKCTVSVTVRFLKANATIRELVAVAPRGSARQLVAVHGASELAVFGVPLQDLECDDVNGKRVPRLLVRLRRLLVEHEGLTVEGIFRLAPDNVEWRRIRDELNRGTYDGEVTDVNCISHLIKVWFRDLPVQILNTVPEEELVSVADVDDAMRLVAKIPQQERDVLLWMLDLMADVVSHEAENKMSVKNCAIVMGPNLYKLPSDADPMEALVVSQKAVSFMCFALESVVQERR